MGGLSGQRVSSVPLPTHTAFFIAVVGVLADVRYFGCKVRAKYVYRGG